MWIPFSIRFVITPAMIDFQNSLTFTTEWTILSVVAKLTSVHLFIPMGIAVRAGSKNCLILRILQFLSLIYRYKAMKGCFLFEGSSFD